LVDIQYSGMCCSW